MGELKDDFTKYILYVQYTFHLLFEPLLCLHSSAQIEHLNCIERVSTQLPIQREAFKFTGHTSNLDFTMEMLIIDYYRDSHPMQELIY